MRANLTLFGPGGEVLATVYRVGTMDVRLGSKLALTLTGSEEELAVVDRWFAEEDPVLSITKNPDNENQRLIEATGEGTSEIFVFDRSTPEPKRAISFVITVFTDVAESLQVKNVEREPRD